jgi:large subunit ribosomal protein L32
VVFRLNHTPVCARSVLASLCASGINY